MFNFWHNVVRPKFRKTRMSNCLLGINGICTGKEWSHSFLQRVLHFQKTHHLLHFFLQLNNIATWQFAPWRYPIMSDDVHEFQCVISSKIALCRNEYSHYEDCIVKHHNLRGDFEASLVFWSPKVTWNALCLFIEHITTKGSAHKNTAKNYFSAIWSFKGALWMYGNVAKCICGVLKSTEMPINYYFIWFILAFYNQNQRRYFCSLLKQL